MNKNSEKVAGSPETIKALVAGAHRYVGAEGAGAGVTPYFQEMLRQMRGSELMVPFFDEPQEKTEK